MDMLSLFRRKPGGAEGAPAEAPDAVQTARTRARRRLIGAAVLVGSGIVGFPLVFETEPRQIPIDVPIEIARKEGATPPQMSAARPEVAASAVAPARPPREAASPVSAAAQARAPEAIITETVADAGREISPRASPASAPMPRAADETQE